MKLPKGAENDIKPKKLVLQRRVSDIHAQRANNILRAIIARKEECDLKRISSPKIMAATSQAIKNPFHLFEKWV